MKCSCKIDGTTNITSFLESIFDNIYEYVYASDPETYEVIFANKLLKEIYGKELIGGKCYKELHNLEEPCTFCNNVQLKKSKGQKIIWEHFNKTLNKCFYIVDKFIEWHDGRYVRLELALDISRRKKEEDDVRRRLAFVETVKTISSRFVGIKPFAEAINECLEDIGRLSGADRAYLFTVDHESAIMTNTHEWCARGVIPQIDRLQDLPTSIFPWWLEKLRRNEVILIQNVTYMPEESAAEQEILTSQDIKSVLVLPIFIGNELKGFIGFDNVGNTDSWSNDDLEHLKVAAELISGAMARMRVEEKLHFAASHDYLTNVPNRYYLEKFLQGIIAEATEEKPSVLLFVDMDNFKVINDTYGHKEGDRVLNQTVSKLRQYIRQGDFLARLGGDEFAIIMQNINIEQAKILAKRVLIKINEDKYNIGPDNIGFNITVSIGIAEIDGTLTPEKVLSNADVALYSAKEEGKNRIVVVKSGDEKTRITYANEIIMLINEGLKNNRYILHYQPIFNSGGSIDHYEALIRLVGINDELIYPNSFLPIAERFGLVSAIDRWVIEQVINLLENQPGRSVFVNISANSLADDELLKYIIKRVVKSRFDSSKLGFEITESTTIKDLPRAKYWINRLKEFGCKIALDDFGSGFTSFQLLNQLPIDLVKIDGSFVKDLDNDPTSLSLVKAMNAVAHTLGKATVAEYVENEKIWQIIKELKIDYGQGYYLGRPKPFS